MKTTLLGFMFIALVLCQTLVKISLVSAYFLNQEYIAKTFCVQKEVENNCCKGKCYLQEELKASEGASDNETDTKSSSLPEKLKQAFEVFYTTEDTFLEKESVYFASFNLAIQNPAIRNFSLKNFSIAVFHPPSN